METELKEKDCHDEMDTSSFGHNHADGEEDEYEEEEILVHVEFDCDVDTKLFTSEQPKIIGLDSDHPIMQMGPQFYRGTWQDTVGTSVFFEPDPDPPPLDPVFSKVKAPLMKLACHTRKSLLMSRVFVKPIMGEKPDPPPAQLAKNVNDVKLETSEVNDADVRDEHNNIESTVTE